MAISKDNTIGEIVVLDYRTAEVFEKYKLDFCCKGDRTIEKACQESGIEPADVVRSLEHIGGSSASGIDYNSWPLDLLADYIEKKHHRYVSDHIPLLQSYLEKISRVHGDAHPELFEIKTQFDNCAGELTTHMKKEELMLFPFIRRMVLAKQSGSAFPVAPFGTVQNPVSMMLLEHNVEGERFGKIATLSNQYTPPSDGCTTYRVALASLKEFEDDLHLHIHLENNILFPKAIALEKSFAN